MNTAAIPKKERLLVQQLRDFIENDKKDNVAVIAGIRKTGKTTILNQLEDYYNKKGFKTLKISLDAALDDCNILDEISEKEPDLLLLDEISFLDGYEMFSQTLYNITAGSQNKRFKAVITGSSPAHIIKLKSGKLGCRSKLFRLPLLTFTEYLYFSDRIESYSDYSSVKNEDFSDYLQLKGLEEKAPGLALTFDEDYFADFYSEIELSNRQSHLSRSITHL
ncbi:MAG: AAA family ATPase [Oscillospiraceae bacterium]|nr:AAA family ATPase [Oscillospiraceae bacterium]